MSKIIDLYYSEDPNDIDEPVGRYERVFDDEILTIVRRTFQKDSELRDLVYAFDALREMIDENDPYRDKVLVRATEQEEYKNALRRLRGGPISKFEMFENASYTSLTLMEIFIRKKEYELIYKFIDMFTDNTVRLALDGIEFILQKNEEKRKLTGFGFIWLCNLHIGKGISLAIKPEIDPITGLTVIPMDADL